MAKKRKYEFVSYSTVGQGQPPPINQSQTIPPPSSHISQNLAKLGMQQRPAHMHGFDGQRQMNAYQTQSQSSFPGHLNWVDQHRAPPQQPPYLADFQRVDDYRAAQQSVLVGNQDLMYGQQVQQQTFITPDNMVGPHMTHLPISGNGQAMNAQQWQAYKRRHQKMANKLRHDTTQRPVGSQQMPSTSPRTGKRRMVEAAVPQGDELRWVSGVHTAESSDPPQDEESAGGRIIPSIELPVAETSRSKPTHKAEVEEAAYGDIDPAFPTAQLENPPQSSMQSQNLKDAYNFRPYNELDAPNAYAGDVSATSNFNITQEWDSASSAFDNRFGVLSVCEGQIDGASNSNPMGEQNGVPFDFAQDTDDAFRITGNLLDPEGDLGQTDGTNIISFAQGNDDGTFDNIFIPAALVANDAEVAHANNSSPKQQANGAGLNKSACVDGNANAATMDANAEKLREFVQILNNDVAWADYMRQEYLT
jgi:hypothetical protein